MASYLTPDWLMQDLQTLLKRRPMTRGQFMRGETTDAAYDLYNQAARLGYNPSESMLAKLHELDRYKGVDTGDTELWHEKDAMKQEWQAYIDHRTGGGTAEDFVAGSGVGDYEGLGYDASWITSSTYGGHVGNIWDQESFGEAAFGQQKDWQTKMPDMSVYTQFTPEMFKKLRTEYYQPEITQKRGSLIGALTGGKETAAGMGGDIAGYGRREKEFGQLGERYRGGVEDIYAGVEQQKASGLQSIYDVLSQYEDLGA